MSYRSPLRNAYGLGSAKDGTHHFMVQRLTGIALVPLMLWLTYSIACLGGADLASVRDFIAHPLNATLLICLTIAVFYHSSLGIQVVLEDYLHINSLRLTLQILVNFTNFALAVVSILAILKLAVAA
ncbi:MAG: succinate dehydrogenase, hydrophobic membrane anchor protein [Pseudomonadota bacterium]